MFTFMCVYAKTTFFFLLENICYENLQISIETNV